MLKWKLDNLEVAVVSGGRMRIDGGAMFGVVPRAVWARAVPPDEAHRIQLDTNCLLIRAGDRCAIVDTGYGSKGSDRAAILTWRRASPWSGTLQPWGWSRPRSTRLF